mmetsp:Transcript_47985/g.114220  ORF Transcript_47985/g.114220 Transcript_47985/m.114220 type:complete len:210 (+) Transcript_47985:908-1537(+)
MGSITSGSMRPRGRARRCAARRTTPDRVGTFRESTSTDRCWRKSTSGPVRRGKRWCPRWSTRATSSRRRTARSRRMPTRSRRSCGTCFTTRSRRSPPADTFPGCRSTTHPESTKASRTPSAPCSPRWPGPRSWRPSRRERPSPGARARSASTEWGSARCSPGARGPPARRLITWRVTPARGVPRIRPGGVPRPACPTRGNRWRRSRRRC